MSIFRNLWSRFFPPIQPLPAGIYHCQMPSESSLPYRLHLRLEPDGRAVLIINASTVVHLNQTAAEIAFHLVRGTDEEQAVNEISRRYNVRREIITRDYHELINRLRELTLTPDLDPVAFLDFDRMDPYEIPGSAPYRIDCALTYRLPNDRAGHWAPLERVTRELTGEEWERTLEKAWNAGVPHAVFTGGEPTLRPDLCQLVAYGERLGMVTGLITDGLRLAESKYLHELLQSGLDHVMIVLDPSEDQAWEGLRDTLAEDIAVTVHLTLRQQHPFDTASLLNRLASMGVKNISFSADSTDLKDALLEAQRAAAEQHQMRLIWDLPAPYSQFHPVAVELSSLEGNSLSAEGNGRGWLYIEPDGDVLTGQGQYRAVLGNILVDDWDGIWQKAAAERLQGTQGTPATN